MNKKILLFKLMDSEDAFGVTSMRANLLSETCREAGVSDGQ